MRGENLLNEFQEALRVECRVYGRDGQGIKLKRFICMFKLLTHVVILQNINDTKVQHHMPHEIFGFPLSLESALPLLACSHQAGFGACLKSWKEN